ncbi:MAG TPA: DUF1638 domain-containing protein, partial [Aggregatilineales bacterium]|jgi:hypothetical protein|nr:DUF1638 domain-containing protein [Aggregatilineales bacterium]HPV07957.1 DUF1638 domain-containing protein [Aggregatilineales bacterium]HQA67460.1 DUF1638 domain-containing protein [Aggregatilineales bacterium]HQE17777.1 DUF1638 domain-containing protein [Aggregatilineales bacterium]
MTVALLACGALAREVLDIRERHGWDADVVALPALLHMHPARLAPQIERRIKELRDHYERIIVVYGDCGSSGAIDEVLERHGVERVDGPHCYEMYGGDLFARLMAEEPGTYFLTDFLLRGFDGLVVKGMGLDRFPDLKGEYFANYKRLAYLVQKPDPALIEKAHEVSRYLGLPLEIYETGYGALEERLAALMGEGASTDRAGDADS